MAKRSDTSPATDGGGLEAPRSDVPGGSSNQQLNPVLTGVSAATASQKRGRGRPAKPKSDSQQNGGVSAQPSRKSVRSKRNGASAASAPTAAAPAAAVKNNRGRPKRSKTLPQKASLVTATTTTVGGSRKRGRPKKDDVTAATVAPAKKRGRKPNTGEVAKTTAGRPRKGTSLATEATTGQEAAGPRELKKKAVLLQKKVKEAADKLKIAVAAIEEVKVLAAGM